MDNRIHREVIGGHLLVIGGAEDKYNERRILKKFLELAGGEKAEVLIVPVASDFPEFASDIYVQAFRRLGVSNPRVLRATSRQDVISINAEVLLEGVTGVFISGGDQMRLVSILGGTPFAQKLRQMVSETIRRSFCAKSVPPKIETRRIWSPPVIKMPVTPSSSASASIETTSCREVARRTRGLATPKRRNACT